MTAVYDSLVRISRNAKQRQQMGTLASDEAQRQSNKRGIARLGGRVGNVYEALDVSGGDVFAHPHWLEALARVENGDSAGVAVAYVDRYGRDATNGLVYADKLTAAGGAIVVDGKAYDLTDPNERLMFVMTLAQAEHYRLTAKKKSRETMDMVKRRGITNRVPYGYERNRRPDGTLTLPGEDQKKLVPGGGRLIVEKVFQMRADGARWTHVIDWLHDQGIDSPSGNPWWTTGTLADMVKNRAYVGEVHMGGHVTKHAHEAIVNERLWKEAQSKATVVRPGKHLPGIAHGLLFCTGCGNPLSLQCAGHGQTFYGCRRRSSQGPCPRPVNGAQEPIDNHVDRLVAEAINRAAIPAFRRSRNLTEAKRAMNDALYDRQQFLLGTKGMEADVIAEALAGLNHAVEQTTAAYEEAKEAAASLAGMPDDANIYVNWPVDKRQWVARQVIERIELKPFPVGGSKRTSKTIDRLDITRIW